MTRERALVLIVGVLAVSLVAVILGQNRTFVSAAQAAPPPACTDALLNGRCCFTEEGYLTNATAFSQAVADSRLLRESVIWLRIVMET